MFVSLCKCRAFLLTEKVGEEQSIHDLTGKVATGVCSTNRRVYPILYHLVDVVFYNRIFSEHNIGRLPFCAHSKLNFECVKNLDDLKPAGQPIPQLKWIKFSR